MSCDHCFYEFSKIYPTFQGLPIFDEHYNFEIYRFCSLNCGLKFMLNEAQERSSKELPKTDLVKKLKNFFDFYNIEPKSVQCAQPRESLKIFGGTLDYETFRKDFSTPYIDPFFGYEND